MRTAIIVLAIILLFSRFGYAQDTWYVPDDFPKIQDAINSPDVAENDIVLVRPGTYMENIQFRNDIVIKSVDGPALTVIDGGNPAHPDDGAVVSFNNYNQAEACLEGFTLINGTGNYTWDPEYKWTRYGGGIYCGFASHPTLRNNIITWNTAKIGVRIGK